MPRQRRSGSPGRSTGRVRPPSDGGTARPAGARQATAPSASDTESPAEVSADEVWRTSRAGARAGRGFHYQDLVGAYLALTISSGAIAAGQITPEGPDDHTLEGVPSEADTQVQVKSRQPAGVDFTVGAISGHLHEMWRRHRPTGTTHRYLLVLERAVAGWTPDAVDRPLSAWAGEPVADELIAALVAKADAAVAAAEVTDLLGLTHVVVLSAETIRQRSADLIQARTGLPRGGTLPVFQALRAEIAERSDANASRTREDRAGLDQSAIERIVTEAVGFVDRESLEEALRSGAATVVDLETLLDDPTFYEGASVQPGHVAARLVVDRPAEVRETLTALLDGTPVLIAGPSGVGKSAVMWLTVQQARHITWYQIQRLASQDVEPILRLARAAGAGRYGPVGFVADGVGTGRLQGWDELHRQSRAVPGMLLLGSIREEDTIQVETLADTALIRPHLDEQLAAALFDRLTENGRTTAPHWREPYEQCNGLTLEFTHLLTRGSRLDDVIGSQIDARLRENRTTELDVLTVVSTADRWATPLHIDNVAAATGASGGDLKQALARLVQEHMVTVDDAGLVSGLHRLRSDAASRAAHRIPPPTLPATLRTLVAHVTAEDLPTLVARATGELPALRTGLADALHERVRDADTATVAATLRAARIADYTVTARNHVDVLARHGVKLPQQPLAFDLGMLDDPINPGLAELFDPALVAAVEENRTTPDETGLLTELCTLIGGSARIGDLVAAAGDLNAAADLLDALAGTALDIPIPTQGALADAAQVATLPELAVFIDAAAAVSPDTGRSALDAAGGQDTIVRRLRAAEPYLLSLSVITTTVDVDPAGTEPDPGPGGASATPAAGHAEGRPGAVSPPADGADGPVEAAEVLAGQLLFVSDRVTRDPRTRLVELAKTALQCLPHVASVDFDTRMPGGAVHAVGDFEPGVSKLLRRYALSDRTVAWNQLRSRYARSLMTQDSTTERLAAGNRTLAASHQFLRDVADAWITNKGTGSRLDRQNRWRVELASAITALAPAGPAATDVLTGTAASSANTSAEPARQLDVLHTIAQAIVINLPTRLEDAAGYASLAAFTHGIRNDLADAAELPWLLLGGGPPPYLGDLDVLLSDLRTVLAEVAADETALPDLLRATRSSRHGHALHDAAVAAAARADLRYAQTLHRIEQAAGAAGHSVTCVSRDDDSSGAYWPPRATAVCVDVEANDFDAVLQDMPGLLTRHPVPFSAADVIGTYDGAPIRALAFHVFAAGNAYPSPDTPDAWHEVLGPVLATPLADATGSALAALVELSALAEPTLRRAEDSGHGELLAAETEAEDGYQTAVADIAAAGTDDVVRWLLDRLGFLHERVRGETGDRPPDAPSFAQEFHDLSTGLTLAHVLPILAMERDLSPARAAELLAELVSDQPDA